MNIQVQICGLIIILLLYAFYKTQKTLKLYREKIFFIVLRCSIATLIFDILSIVGIHYRSVLPAVAVHTLCKAYLLSIMLSSFAALFYVLVDLMTDERRMKLFRRTVILAAAEIAAILLCPIDVFEESRTVYSLGPAVVLTYLFTICYIVATLVVAAVFLYKINRRRACAVILWMGCWILAAAIQFVHNELLLVGFSGAIGMVILYVMLEAPEASLDKQFNCFNSYAFDVYCQDMRTYGRRFSLLEVNMVGTEPAKDISFHPIRSPMKVISAVSRTENVLVFKNVDYSIYVVSEEPERLQEVYRSCRELIGKFGMLKQVEFLLVEDSGVFANSVELSELLSYSHGFCADRAGELVQVTESMIHSFREEGRIAEEIRQALSEDRVEVWLQPIYSIQTGRFETAEALVRIRSREGGQLSPGVFIPVAEKRGLIVELGERIFEKVCAFIAREDLRSLGVHYIEVNLSVVQCERAELAEQLSETMKRHGIEPRQVNFEITETGSVKTKIPLLENMSKLTKKGATFSLDDFGKGESNLIYLIDMPVSILKMDYDLTKSYQESEKAQHVIDSLVNLAHSLGLKVVAEGIETAEELEIFTDTGVDYIQGFYFSRPMPMEEYLEFLKAHAPAAQTAADDHTA